MIRGGNSRFGENRSFRILLVHYFLLLSLIGTTGCVEKRLEKRIFDATRSVFGEQVTLTKSWGKHGRKLEWQAACKLLEQHNQRLKQARLSHSQIERERNRFVIDQLSPRLAAVANLSSALGDLAKLRDDGYGIRLYGTFSVPNPLTAYARRYSLELQYYQSALALHELERRLRVTLYGQFLMHRYALESIPVREFPLRQDASWRGLLDGEFQQSKAKLAELDRQRQLRVSLNQLLNTPGENWIPEATTLPDISYEAKLGALDPDRGYGLLAMKQAAGQVEAALANLWRVKMEKLPSFSSGVSIPTLYDSVTDQDGLSGQELRLFGSLNESFDFTGSGKMSTERAEERARFVQESLRARMEQEIHSLERAKRNYEALVAERDALERSLRWIRRNPPPGSNSKVLLGRLEEERGLVDRLRRNEQQRRQLDLEFWIWDETCWKSPF